MKIYTATAKKEVWKSKRKLHQWWLVECEELDVMGQARSLSEVDEVAKEVIGLWLDVDPETINVEVSIIMPEEIKAAWDESRQLKSEAEKALTHSGEIARETVKKLRENGFTQKEAARVLGISPQRIHQLEKAS